MAEQAIAEVESFQVTLMIRRFDPETDQEPRWVDYDVQMFGTDRVLDALHQIKWEVDGSLTFRRSCAHGVCGLNPTRPVVFELGSKGFELSCIERVAHLLHEVEVVVQVVNGGEHGAEHFAATV